jgi:dienelactone hydrolase
MVGHLALPEGDDRRPAVLIGHEALGLDETQRERAEELARLGYVALAVDCWGGGQILPPEERKSRTAEMRADRPHVRMLGRAALDALLAEPRVDPSRLAAIGYCFGGMFALELARTGADLKAIVGFHPTLINPYPAESVNITGRVLVFVGSDDPFISLGERIAFEDEMRTAGVDWEMRIFGGLVHSFTKPGSELHGLPGFAYNERAARKSWNEMLSLLEETLGPPAGESGTGENG